MADASPTLIGYARVSTEDQNLALQMDALVGAGVDETRVYTDKASAARGKVRPGLAAAFKALEPGDVLVVWKLDRLGRNLEELIRTVRRIQEKGAHFRCLTQPMDTSTPMGTLIFHVFGAMAEFERELIRERTIAGLAAARARGRVGGRRPVLTAEKQEAAKAALARGATVREAASKVGVSPSALYKWLDAVQPEPLVHDPETGEVTGK